jgi:hypothetical protein
VQSIPFQAFLKSSLTALCCDLFGIYPHASDHEAPGEIGWLCYSVKPQDDKHLSHLFSKLCDEHVGVKWKIIKTRLKPDPCDKGQPFALHVEGPGQNLHECTQKLLQWYRSNSRSFLDGTKMQLIPPWHNIFAQENKVKVGTLVTHQVALNVQYGHATTQ